MSFGMLLSAGKLLLDSPLSLASSLLLEFALLNMQEFGLVATAAAEVGFIKNNYYLLARYVAYLIAHICTT